MQQKIQSNDLCLFRSAEFDRHNFLSFWVIFCTFTQLLTRKIKIWKNIKRTCRYYTFTYAHHKSRSYDVWFLKYKVQTPKFFVILDLFFFFCPLTLLTTTKPKIWKNKKMPADIIILHLCNTNDNHDVWFLIYQAQHGIFCLFLSEFWAIFCPFTPLAIQKIKISKIWKTLLEILSFTQV